MQSLTISFHEKGDDPWPDLQNPGQKVCQADLTKIAVVNKATAKGLPGVAFRITLNDGSVVTATTTAKLFVSMGKAILAKYPKLLD